MVKKLNKLWQIELNLESNIWHLAVRSKCGTVAPGRIIRHVDWVYTWHRRMGGGWHMWGMATPTTQGTGKVIDRHAAVWVQNVTSHNHPLTTYRNAIPIHSIKNVSYNYAH